MAEDVKPAVPGWYWVVAIVALLWEATGCYAYLSKVTMDAGALAAMPAAEREIWTAMPTWVTAAYALAVWVGLTGAVGLLLRQSWARPAFMVSLAAVAVQFGWALLATPLLNTLGASAMAFPAFILAVAVALVWFASLATKRGWLR